MHSPHAPAARHGVAGREPAQTSPASEVVLTGTALPLENVHNLRDLGGLRSRDGHVGEWSHAGQGVQDTRIPDSVVRITRHKARGIETEAAYAMARRLARALGLLVGISSGANVASALAVAQEIEHGVVVTMLCDGADKYLSERFWEEP